MEISKGTPFQDQWDEAILSNDLRKSLQIAIEGYQASCKSGDRENERLFYFLIKASVYNLFKSGFYQENKKTVTEEEDKSTCSFCKKDDVRIEECVFGTNVMICSSCIKLAYDEIYK